MMGLPVLGPGAFRFLLAAFVLASHLSRYEVGRPAVFVFFMLSGYWVMKMYAEKYQPRTTLGVFYLSRLMRIWVPYSIVFLLVFLIYRAVPVPGTDQPDSYLWGVLMLGVASTHLDVLGTSWSLDIELQFYLLVPLFLVAVRTLPPAGLFLCAGALTMLGWILQLRYDLWTVFSYLPAFLMGILIWSYGWKCSGRHAALSVVIFLGIGAAVWLTPSLQPLLLRDVESPFHEDWFGLAWTATLIPLLIWNVRQRSSWLDQHLGALSFMLYIVHWPVINLLRKSMAPLGTPEKILLLAAIPIVTLVVYMLVDRPLERVRKALLRTLRV